LNNAIKFTHEGSVVLDVKPEKSLKNGSYLLRFEVKDTGIGVKAVHLNKIF